MNIGEAHDVNTLLRWALNLPRPEPHDADHPLTGAVEATEAAQRLAGRAFKTLGAGLQPDGVHLTSSEFDDYEDPADEGSWPLPCGICAERRPGTRVVEAPALGWRGVACEVCAQGKGPMRRLAANVARSWAIRLVKIKDSGPEEPVTVVQVARRA